MIPQKDCCSVQQASCYHKDKLKDEAFSDVIKKTFRICFGDKTIVGKNFRAYYQPISSEVKDTGFFQNGAEAVWERLYGAGKVIALGTSFDDFKVYKDGKELGTISPGVLANAKTVE